MVRGLYTGTRGATGRNPKSEIGFRRSEVVAFRLAAEVTYPDLDPIEAQNTLRSNLAAEANRKGVKYALNREDYLAQSCFRDAVCLLPQRPEPWVNLGDSLCRQCQYEDAIEAYRHGLALDPSIPIAWHNLGGCLSHIGQMAAAEVALRSAIKIKPDYSSAHTALGQLLLLQGKFTKEAWAEYEWRHIGRHPDISVVGPVWQGEPLEGKTILLHTEQGYGDGFQYARYVPYLKRLGAARVNLNAHRACLPLFRSLPGLDALVAQGDPIPEFDYQAAIMSLGDVLKLDEAGIPNGIPYLSVPPELREKHKLPKGFNVGLCWQGSTVHSNDHERSMSVDLLKPLADAHGATFWSLQWSEPHPEWMNPLVESADFQETAAMILNLDLVVTVDTSIGHLAGALGVPTWIMLPRIPDWRWMLDRSDTPWYPKTRLFRCKTVRGWEAVVERVRSELEAACSFQI